MVIRRLSLLEENRSVEVPKELEFIDLWISLEREPVVPEPPLEIVFDGGGAGAGVLPELEDIEPPPPEFEELDILAGAVFLAGAGVGLETFAGALLVLLAAGGELIPDDLATRNSSLALCSHKHPTHAPWNS